MPRGQRKAAISTDDIETQAAAITIDPISGEVSREDIEVVQPTAFEETAAFAKFMEEFVVIQVDMDDDPNSPVFIPTGHQGITQYIRRNTEQRIRRKFLYSLLAGKKKQFACAFGKDNSGEPFNRMSPSSRTTYRLQVIKDTPEGMKQFAKWMREE